MIAYISNLILSYKNQVINVLITGKLCENDKPLGCISIITITTIIKKITIHPRERFV